MARKNQTPRRRHPDSRKGKKRLRVWPAHQWPCVCGLWHDTGELCPDGGWIV